MNFDEFKLNDQLLEAISYMGFEEATPIQEKAIPEIMEGKDVIASAQTGTGKTAAYILPVLHFLSIEEQKGINTLIIVPTRELAIQIDQQIQGFSYFVPVHSYPVYGGGDGEDWSAQRTALESGSEIIVATPGKLISHINMGYVSFDNLKHLILDEADKMLDMGFLPDIKKIESFLPKKRQTLLFSATMPDKIRQLAKQILIDPVEISLQMSKPAEGVLQAAYLAYDKQKVRLIHKLIADKPDYKSILIFSSTKLKVAEIAKSLKSKDYNVEGISSDLDQDERNNVLSRFKAKQTRILVATDVLSRGIDIKDINLIINYDVPQDAEDYVHRVGRTARAKTTGVAITLVNGDDMFRFSRIEKLIERDIIKLPLPPEIGEGPEWETRSAKKGQRRKPERKGRKTTGRKPARGKGSGRKK